MKTNNIEINEINKYFREFILENRDSFFYDEISKQSIKKIESKPDAEFHSNWNFLMLLTEIIESVFNVHGISLESNYCRFEFQNGYRIQDKAMNKFGALYSCCYQTLDEKWTNHKAPEFDRGSEPFDLDEL
jgi:hypothetical protein